MRIACLLDDLRRRGVELLADGGKLRWRAPTGRMTSRDVAQLRAGKSELLRILTASPVASGVAADEDPHSDLNQRRALYVLGRRHGFPRIELLHHGRFVKAGEDGWHRFARNAVQHQLWEAALVLDDLPIQTTTTPARPAESQI